MYTWLYNVLLKKGIWHLRLMFHCASLPVVRACGIFLMILDILMGDVLSGNYLLNSLCLPGTGLSVCPHLGAATASAGIGGFTQGATANLNSSATSGFGLRDEVAATATHSTPAAATGIS